MADKDANVIHPQVSSEEEELEEEALSLCDLPLNDMSSKEIRPSSSSDASELFEFFNDVVADMCPADDIFFSGKLVSFEHKPQSNPPSIDQKAAKESSNPPTRRLRSDPISGLQSPVSRSNSVGTCTSSRNSRSLDYRKLRRSSTVNRATKPRWHSVMFGTVKVPPEMELSDIKNRQVRRNPSMTMFPAVMDGGGKPVENRSSGKVSWRILKVLNCKGRRSVSVTTSLAVPQAT